MTEKAEQLRRAERDRLAVELRRRGMALDPITAKLNEAGFTVSRATVASVLAAHLKRAHAELEISAETFRAELMDRLNALLDASWDWAMGGSVRHIGEARHIVSDMADLMGVKAPVRHEFGESDVDRLLREATEELERRAADAGRQASDTQAGPREPGAAE